MKLTAFLLALIFPIYVYAGDAVSVPFKNFSSIVQELNLQPYFSKSKSDLTPVKIAIFDNGFLDYQKAIAQKLLPANTQYHAGPVASPQPEEQHGLYMAEITYLLLTNGTAASQFSPKEFHLYNTFGYSNFQAAIDDAIKKKIDIILYSQTWEYGGNFDGGGFINALVNKATSAGILWVNNSGNFGVGTFNTSITIGADSWVNLPNANNALEIRCEKNPVKEKCGIRIVLSWNDFKDDVNLGTDKDLDLALTDDMLNIVQASSLVQSKTENRAGFSKYSREILTAEINPGIYYVRVKNRSNNFTDQDKLRITVSGDFITMKEYDPDESLLPPADNATVITVGALDSERSSRSRSLGKPEVATNSLVSISKEENYKGTSNSAAMVAASIAVLKSITPNLTREDILNMVSSGSGSNSQGRGKGLAPEILGFSFTGPGCYKPVDTRYMPKYVKDVLNLGGTMVQTTAGQKIFLSYDPERIFPMSRGFMSDMLGVSAGGVWLYPRSMLFNLPSGFFEVLQTPFGQNICGEVHSPVADIAMPFRLPN